MLIVADPPGHPHCPMPDWEGTLSLATQEPRFSGLQVDKLTTPSQDSHQGPAVFPASALKEVQGLVPPSSESWLSLTCLRKLISLWRDRGSTEDAGFQRATKTLKEFLPWRWKPLPLCDWRPLRLPGDDVAAAQPSILHHLISQGSPIVFLYKS